MRVRGPEHRAWIETAARHFYQTNDVYVDTSLIETVRGRKVKHLSGTRVILGMAISKLQEGPEVLEAFFEELRAAKWPAKEVDQVRAIMSEHGEDLIVAAVEATERYATEYTVATGHSGET